MPAIFSDRRRLSRRHFLRGAGAAVALPLLDAMAARGGPPAARPARSVFVYIPNGVNVWTWQILQAGAGYKLSEPMRSLERHRADLTPISGLHHGAGFGANHMCGENWLTGAPLDFSGAAPYRNTVSADQVIAETAGADTRHPSLELSVQAGVGSAGAGQTLAYTRDGQPLPAEDNPRGVFDRLFGDDPAGAAGRRRAARRAGSVLDLIAEDARALDRTLGHADKAKLDEYLHAVRDVELRVKRSEQWLDIPAPKVDERSGEPFRREVTKAQAGTYYRTMYDLIVLALRTDMTRVVTYMSGTEGNGLAIPEIGLTQTRHELSHHNNDPDAKLRLAKSDTFLVEQFSYFLDKLKAATDDGEPLLDRTMVLFGSGMSYGHSHGNANLPIVLAGGRKLGLRHGRHLDYNLPKVGGRYDMAKLVGWCHGPLDGKALLSNVLLTMIQRMGVPADKFADSTGPVAELIA